MGADLIFSICEMEAKKDKAYENAKYLVADERWENTRQFLEDNCGVYVDDYATSDDVLTLLTDSIDVVYGSQSRRDCSLFYVDNRLFYITAGLSWGDEPTDAYQSFNVCETFGLTLNQPLSMSNECSHPIETWKHHHDPDNPLGDYYTCGECGEVTQVG